MVADKIEHLWKSMGMTQTSFAKQLGIAWSSVNAWEMGVSAPSMQHIVKLTHIFKVSIDYLLGVIHRQIVVLRD